MNKIVRVVAVVLAVSLVLPQPLVMAQGGCKVEKRRRACCPRAVGRCCTWTVVANGSL